MISLPEGPVHRVHGLPLQDAQHAYVLQHNSVQQYSIYFCALCFGLYRQRDRQKIGCIPRSFYTQHEGQKLDLNIFYLHPYNLIISTPLLNCHNSGCPRFPSCLCYLRHFYSSRFWVRCLSEVLQTCVQINSASSMGEQVTRFASSSKIITNIHPEILLLALPLCHRLY